MHDQNIGSATHGYTLIAADPPWKYNNRVDHVGGPQHRTRFGGGAQAHYAMMTDQEIIELGSMVQAIAAPNSLLALWTTMPKLDIAMAAEALRPAQAPSEAVRDEA